MGNRPSRPIAGRIAFRSALCINLTSLAVLGAFSLATSTEAHAQEVAVQIDLPAQPLDDSLIQLGRQTNLQFFYTPEAVAGIWASLVHGRMTPEQALQRLLQGTPVQYQREGKNVTLSRLTEATQLEPVTVIADAMRDGTTEGTGSYTTSSTNTATKLNLSLRETPQTITVVTRQQMDDFSMTSVDDALQSISGVTVNRQAGSTYFYSRGFQMQQQYDGVPNPLGISNTYNPSIDSAFIDRVDALQGAAGLMTGAGNPGGTINLIRKRPTDTFQAQTELQVGSWNQKRAVVDISGPLIESGRIRGRLVAVAEDKDSFVDYSYLKRKALYGVIDADLSPTTKLSASFQYQHDKTNSSNGVVMASDGSDLGLSRSTYFGDPDQSYLKTYALLSLSLEQELSQSWKSKVSFQRSINNVYADNYGYVAGSVNKTTGDGLKIYGGSDYKRNPEYDAFDVSVSGPLTLFDKKHELAFGVSGYDYHDNYGGLGYATTGIPINVYTWSPSTASLNFNPDWTYAAKSNTRQTGAYAVGRFELTSALKAIIGTRISWYKARTSYLASTSTTGKPSGSEQSESGVVTPYAGLTYDLNRDFTAYVSYSDIFNPSTYKSSDGGYLKPVVGKNYEIGVKGELLEKRLNVAAAVFRLEQTNLAEQDQSIPYSSTNICGGYCYTAAGEVVSQGVSLSAYGEIHPDWSLAAGYTYVDSKYAAGANDGTRYMTTLPQHSLRLGVNHRLRGTSWTLGGSLRVQSKITNTGSSYTIRQGGYAVVGLTARYAINPQADLLLTVDNLFDRRYYASVYGLSYAAYGEPRKVSATLRYRF